MFQSLGIDVTVASLDKQVVLQNSAIFNFFPTKVFVKRLQINNQPFKCDNYPK